MTRVSRCLTCMTLLSIAVISLGADAGAQGSQKCRPADPRSSNMISGIKRFVSSTDPKTVYQRDSIMHLPVVSTSQISLVTDERVCAKVVDAYLTVPNGYTPVNVYVVKMGSKGYVAYDPDRIAGEFTVVFVFSTKYVRTGGWVGG